MRVDARFHSKRNYERITSIKIFDTKNLNKLKNNIERYFQKHPII